MKKDPHNIAARGGIIITAKMIEAGLENIPKELQEIISVEVIFSAMVWAAPRNGIYKVSEKGEATEARHLASIVGALKFMGNQCKYGHSGERWTSNGSCCQCMVLRQRKLKRKRDPEERARAQRTYLSKQDKRTHHQALISKRRKYVREQPGSHTGEEIIELGRRQKWKCANPVCRKNISVGYTVDHIIAVSKGGTNDIRNIQLMCKPCNSSKAAKDPIKWAQDVGMLI